MVHQPSPDHVVGIVLAAGAGTRFGMPKVLAAEGNWLRLAVAALSDGGCGDVIVVLGAAVVDVPSPARAIVADDWSSGLGASVRAGLHGAGSTAADFAVLHTVDTPGIGADVVRRVLAAALSGDSTLARAVYSGRPGHPVVLGRAHWAAVGAAAVGDRGAGPYLRARDDVVEVECSDLATGHDIDVPGG